MLTLPDLLSLPLAQDGFLSRMDARMLQERSSGLLLHPTSLPGPAGIGDLGAAAYEFVDFLAAARQRYWQMLPLCPTAAGHSPYQSPSSFAGNPLLINLERLAADGLLEDHEVQQGAAPPEETGGVHFDQVIQRKLPLVFRAAQRLIDRPAEDPLQAEFQQFCDQHARWLPAHGLFFALRDLNDGLSWLKWTKGVNSLCQAESGIEYELAPSIRLHQGVQYLFFRQWLALREYARQRQVLLIGDVPIYVSHDSVEVWGQRDEYQLTPEGQPIVVAGVPPDYFSATGQLWNNPLYDWGRMAERGYAWWISRVRAALALVDLVRLDHFRGFEAYWAVTAGSETAIDGRWIPGPGGGLIEAFANAFAGGDARQLPLIAEDLGLITAEVDQLRLRFDLPGMKVLQFMLPGEHWKRTDPVHFEANSVVYTGTHDNDTTLGWFRSKILSEPNQLELLRTYTPAREETIAREFLELAWRSGSNLAIAPVQDVLGLPSECRMNLPGTSGDAAGNWRWRLDAGACNREVAGWLGELTVQCGRA